MTVSIEYAGIRRKALLHTHDLNDEWWRENVSFPKYNHFVLIITLAKIFLHQSLGFRRFSKLEMQGIYICSRCSCDRFYLLTCARKATTFLQPGQRTTGGWKRTWLCHTHILPSLSSSVFHWCLAVSLPLLSLILPVVVLNRCQEGFHVWRSEDIAH